MKSFRVNFNLLLQFEKMDLLMYIHEKNVYRIQINLLKTMKKSKKSIESHSRSSVKKYTLFMQYRL